MGASARAKAGVEAEAKRALRVEMRARRAALPSAERERLSELACARLLGLPEVREAQTIAVYCAFGSELRLDALVRELGSHKTAQGDAAVATGAPEARGPKTPEASDVRGPHDTRATGAPMTLLAPVTLGAHRLAFVPVSAAELLAREEGRSAPAFLAHPGRPTTLPPNRPAAQPKDIDLMLVPGLAFDERGMRLGYGAGYYDAWLADANDASQAKLARPLTIGICFDEQLVVCVPVEPHDRPADLVITPTRTLRIR